MKNLVSIITIICMSMALTVQASNDSNQPVDNRKILPVDLFADMDILSIKDDLDNNRRYYYMTGSFTTLKRPSSTESDVARAVDVSFRNTEILSLGNYIQANAKATRNDNNSINEFRIYVHQDRNNQGQVDENNIKVNWKTGSLEVVDKLDNVAVIYQEDSILIIGTMEKNGFTIGVSLAISKQKEIILLKK